MMTLLPGRILGFPPVHTWQRRRASPNALQEGRVAPSGVTTSVSAKPTGISPDPRNPATNAPSCSTILAAHQHAPPRPCRHRRRLTVANKTGPTGSRRTSRERETAGRQTRWRDPPPPPPASTGRTHRQEQTRPTWPGRTRGGS
jgi:hypothetical protein